MSVCVCVCVWVSVCVSVCLYVVKATVQTARPIFMKFGTQVLFSNISRRFFQFFEIFIFNPRLPLKTLKKSEKLIFLKIGSNDFD